MLYKPSYEYNRPEDPIYTLVTKSSAGCLYSLGHLLVHPHLHSRCHLLAHASAAIMLTYCTAIKLLFARLEDSFPLTREYILIYHVLLVPYLFR